MPVVRTIYRPAVDMHDEVSLSAGATLSYPVRDSDDAVVQATASGSKVEILDAAGTVLHTESTVTPSATLTATVAVSASDLSTAGLTYGYAYRTKWTLVLASDTEVYTNMLGIVRTPFPFSVLRVADLTDAHTGLDVLIEGSGKTLGTWIDRGHQKLVRWMRTQANRPSAAIAPSDLKDLALTWTLELLFRDLSTGHDSEHPYVRDYMTYRDERMAQQAILVFVADVSQDGAIDDMDHTGGAPVYLAALPATSYGTLR